MVKPLAAKIFFVILFCGAIIAVFFVFKPFMTEIIAAAILVSVFYRPYEWLKRKMAGHSRLAAALMCLLIALLVIIPVTNFIIYAAQRSISAYEGVVRFLEQGRYSEWRENMMFGQIYNYLFAKENIGLIIIDLAKQINNWFVNGAASLIKSTTNFFISLVLIFFTMFFFFVDGQQMINKLMRITPLPDKYDQAIFKKFHDVSYFTFVSTFITAAAQGLIGAIGFIIVGLPAFFAGVAMGFLSLLPLFGPAFIWLPVSAYLLAAGKIWQGIFLLAWGIMIVSTCDNLIRAYIIKGKAEVHPIFLIFSILGGISLFGFWGIVFGPLIISLAVTIFHIYEIEYIGGRGSSDIRQEENLAAGKS